MSLGEAVSEAGVADDQAELRRFWWYSERKRRPRVATIRSGESSEDCCEEFESLHDQSFSTCFVRNALWCSDADAGPADYLQRPEHRRA